MYFTDHIRLTSITSEVSFLFCHQEVSDHSAGSDEGSDVTITKVISQVRFIFVVLSMSTSLFSLENYSVVFLV